MDEIVFHSDRNWLLGQEVSSVEVGEREPVENQVTIDLRYAREDGIEINDPVFAFSVIDIACAEHIYIRVILCTELGCMRVETPHYNQVWVIFLNKCPSSKH